MPWLRNRAAGQPVSNAWLPLQTPCLLDVDGVRCVSCSGCSHLKDEGLFPQARRGWNRQCCVCREMNQQQTPQDPRVLPALPQPPPGEPVFICGKLPAGAPWPGRLVGIRCAVYLPPREDGGPYIPCPEPAFDRSGTGRHASHCCSSHREKILHRMDASVIATEKFCSDCRSWLDPEAWSPSAVNDQVVCLQCFEKRAMRTGQKKQDKRKQTAHAGPPEVLRTLHDEMPVPEHGLEWFLRYVPSVPKGMVKSESSKWPNYDGQCRVADCCEDAFNKRAAACVKHMNDVLCLQTQDGWGSVVVYYCRTCQMWRSVASLQEDGRCHDRCFKAGKQGSKAPIKGDHHLKLVLQRLAEAPELRSKAPRGMARALGLGTCDHTADAEGGRCRFKHNGERCTQKIHKKHASLMCRNHCHNVVLRLRGAEGGDARETITWYCPRDHCQRICSIDGVGVMRASGGYVCSTCYQADVKLQKFALMARSKLEEEDGSDQGASGDDTGSDSENEVALQGGGRCVDDVRGAAQEGDPESDGGLDLGAMSESDEELDWVVGDDRADEHAAPARVPLPALEPLAPINPTDASGRFRCRGSTSGTPCGKMLSNEQAIDGFCITCLASTRRTCSALDAAVLVTIPGTLHRAAGASTFRLPPRQVWYIYSCSCMLLGRLCIHISAWCSGSLFSLDARHAFALNPGLLRTYLAHLRTCPMYTEWRL